MLQHVQTHIIDELRALNRDMGEYELGMHNFVSNILTCSLETLTSREHCRTEWNKWTSRADICFPKKVGCLRSNLIVFKLYK